MSMNFQSQFLSKMKEKASSPNNPPDVLQVHTNNLINTNLVSSLKTKYHPDEKEFLKDSIFVNVINQEKGKNQSDFKQGSESKLSNNNSFVSNYLDSSLLNNESKNELLLKKKSLLSRSNPGDSASSDNDNKSKRSENSKILLKNRNLNIFNNSFKNSKQNNSDNFSKNNNSFDSEKGMESSFKKSEEKEITEFNKLPSKKLSARKSFQEDNNKVIKSLQNSKSGSNLGYSESNRKIIKREKICESDTEDEGSENEKEVKWIILPDNKYKQMFDIIIALIILYSSIVLPYNIAFIDAELAYDDVLDQVFNALFSVDIILNFFSAYTDIEDNIIKSRRRIVMGYLKGWFAIDLVSVLPINNFMSSSGSSVNALARLSRIPKLYRLVRLTKLFRMVKIFKKGNVNKVTKFFLDKLKVNANIERLVYFVLGFLLLNHLAACIWYFVAKLEDLNPDCWVTRLGYIDASNLEIYIASFYWTLTTVTTVGYGDINAGTTVERIYNLVIMSFGVLMYSFAIGSLSSIVSTLDARTAEMNQKLQILSSIRKEFGLDQEIYDKVRKVIKFDLSRNQKDKMNFLQELPNKLRIELSQIMHDSVIQKMYFFKDQPSDFIAYVAPLLKPVKFSQNDFLYKEGDMIDEMYFVSKGTVSFCLDKRYLEKEIKEIKKHNNFGEIEMCLNEKLAYNIRIKSRNCELFVLKKNDFLRLSVNFKEFIEKFLQRSLMIYLRFNDEKKKLKKGIEDQIRKNNVGGVNLGKSQMMTIKTVKEGLEIVDEKVDEEASEEYDIFGDHTESEIKSSISRSDSISQKNSGEHSGNSSNDEPNKNSSQKNTINFDNINNVNNSQLYEQTTSLQERQKKKNETLVSVGSNNDEKSNSSSLMNITSNNPLHFSVNNIHLRNNNLSENEKEVVSNINLSENVTIKKTHSSSDKNLPHLANLAVSSHVPNLNSLNNGNNLNINNNLSPNNTAGVRNSFHLLSNLNSGVANRKQSIINPSVLNMFSGNVSHVTTPTVNNNLVSVQEDNTGIIYLFNINV